MAINYCEKTKTYTVSYHKRHPVTREPMSMRRIGIKSKAEANRVYAELVVLVDKKINSESVPTWAEAVGQYIQDCRLRGLSENMISGYEHCLNAFTMEQLGHMAINKITREDVFDCFNSATEGKSESFKKWVLKGFRQVFNHAILCGKLTSNPTPELRFKIGEKISPVLNKVQAKAFLDKARELNDEWYPVWFMALYTGMRTGELYALRWSNVDLESGKIYVRENWDRHEGFKPHTKSYHDRIVDIAPELALLLKELKLRSGLEPFVLPRIRQWTQGEQARDLKRFLVGVGLPDITFHELRTSWATMLLSEGVAPIKVMKLGGWRDLKTMQHYIRRSAVDIDGALANFSIQDPTETKGEVVPLVIGSKKEFV